MRSLKATTEQAHVYAIANSADHETMTAWAKAGAAILEGNNLHTFAEKVNHGYRHTTEPWLLLAGDDVRFHAGWLEAAQKVGTAVVGTNDLVNPRVLKGEHTCHPLIRRSYIDEHGASWDGPGVVAHEGYGHWFCDDEMVTAAKQRGVWGFASDAIIEHLHPLWGSAPMDATYELGASHAERDRQAFEKRLKQFAPERELVRA